MRTRPAAPNESKSRRIEKKESVELSALKDGEVAVRPWESRGLKLYAIHLNAMKEDAVLEETQLTETRQPDSRAGYILVRVMEEDLGKRIAKAFENVIAHCKAAKKPEPF